MTKAHWEAVRASLLRDERESAMYALVGRVTTSTRDRLIVRELISLADEDYTVREGDQIVIRPATVNRVIARCEQENLGILLMHSHPFEEGDVWFSPVDDWGEARELRVFHSCGGGAWRLASLVLGQSTVAARIWDFSAVDDPKTDIIDEIVVLGDHLERQPTVGAEVPRPLHEEAQARQVLAFGAEGQGRLSRATVAIVGAGGTGSAAAEMAARLGVGQILLVDSDTVEPSNLSRVYGSTRGDVGRKKVHVLKEWIEKIGSTKVTAVENWIHHDAAVLKEADVILCCTDTQVSRAVCNQAAYQYGIPLIDMGNRIHAPRGTIEAASAQYTVVGPGRACLDCYGMIDYDRVRAELLSPEEYARLRKEGYVVGLDIPEPSVITLNTVIASLAMTRLLDLLAHTGGSTAPKTVYSYLDGELRAAFAAPKSPCTCAYAFGRGDSIPLHRK